MDPMIVASVAIGIAGKRNPSTRTQTRIPSVVEFGPRTARNCSRPNVYPSPIPTMMVMIHTSGELLTIDVGERTWRRPISTIF